MNQAIYNYAYEKLKTTKVITLSDLMWNNGRNCHESMGVLRRLWRCGVVCEGENGEYHLFAMPYLEKFNDRYKDNMGITEHSLRYRAQMITKEEVDALELLIDDERRAIKDEKYGEAFAKLIERRLCYEFDGCVFCDFDEEDFKIVRSMIGVTAEDKLTTEEIDKKKDEFKKRQQEREKTKPALSGLGEAIRRFNEQNKGGVISTENKESKPVEKNRIESSTPVNVSIVFDRFGIMPHKISVIQPARYTVESFIKKALKTMLPDNQVECVGRKACEAIDKGQMKSALSAFVSTSKSKRKKVSIKASMLSIYNDIEGDDITITVEERDEINEEWENDRYAIQVSVCARGDEVDRCDITSSNSQTVKNVLRGALLRMIKQNGSDVEILQDAFMAVAGNSEDGNYTFFIVEIKDGEEKVARELNLDRKLIDEIYDQVVRSRYTGKKVILRMTHNDKR